MHLLLLCFAALASLKAEMAVASWSQMNADCGATNYVNFQGKRLPAWNFTSGTYTYRAVAASAAGNLFIVNSAATDKAAVTALSPKGKVLWTSKPLGDVLSNLLLDATGTVLLVVGVSIDYDNSTLYNIDASSGKARWSKQYPEIATSSLLTWSNVSNAVFFGNYDYRNLLAVSVKDGSVLWNTTGLPPLYESQSVGVSCSGKMVFLPTNVNGGGDSNGTGTVTAFQATTGKRVWATPTNLSIDGRIASGGGVLHGGVGDLGPDGDALFALDVATGKPLWSVPTLCDCKNFSEGTQGPAVDSAGNAYFSCGNQVFSVDRTGKKRWMSSIFSKSGKAGQLNTCAGQPPSLDPVRQLVYFIHSNSTVLYSLSSRDGSLNTFYHIGNNNASYSHPPILLGGKAVCLVSGPAYSVVKTVETIFLHG